MTERATPNFDQLKTILWLRWRLTQNQWKKSGGLGAIIAGVVTVAVTTLSFVSFVGALLLGIFVLGPTQPSVLMLVWLGLTAGFLFMWMIGLVSELQRSETIDLQRLLHLPVRLGQIFVVNYVTSHLSISVMLLVPAALGLALGLAFSRGPLMLLMIPLWLAMVFMVSAWTYLLRGWLATLMTNPRRRRAVVMGISAAFILIAQAPNIYFNVVKRIGPTSAQRSRETKDERAARGAREGAEFQSMLRWQVVAPPLWVPVGARALAEGRVVPALLGMLGAAAIGALGLRRAYTSTLRFYRGESGGTASAPPRAVAKAAARSAVSGRIPLVARRLPRVPEQAAAVALATLQSMLRAPEIKMQWGSSFVVTLAVGAPLLFRSAANFSAAAGPFVATGVVIFSMFLTIGATSNQFGFDRDGFRALVLSPAERWQILFGKNLAAFPVFATSATILITIVTIWLRLSPVVFVATLLQLVVVILIAWTAGNLMSILVPYKIQPGSMKPTKMPGRAVLLMVVAQLTVPIFLAPALIPAAAGFAAERFWGASAASVNLALSAVFAVLAALAYWHLLAPLGHLLRRRETTILQTVSVDVE